MSRSEIAGVIATFNMRDRVHIEWRIVDLQLAYDNAANDLAAIPLITWEGTIVEVDTIAHTVIVDFGADGQFGLPPQMIEGGFIEVHVLTRAPPLLPTLASLARVRPRDADDAHGAPPAGPQDEALVGAFDRLTAAVTKTSEPKGKVDIVKGTLTMVESDNVLWAPFMVYRKILLAKSQGEQGALQLGTAIRIEFNDMLVNTPSGSSDSTVLRAYNDARDTYIKYIIQSHTTEMSTKAHWNVAFDLLAMIVKATCALKMVGSKAELEIAESLRTQWTSGNFDVAPLLDRIFQPRGTADAPGTKGDGVDKRKRKAKTPKDPAAVLGAATAGTRPNEAQCKFCKKWHSGGTVAVGTAGYWRLHRCK